MDKKEMGTAIKLRRRQLGIGQETLADLAEVSINTVVAVERGSGNPKLDTILALLKALGLTLEVTK